MKDESVWTRTHHDFKRACQGPLTEWEDVFVSVYGLRWREHRDSCASEQEWHQRIAHFVNEVCKTWRLPIMGSKVGDVVDDGARDGARDGHVKAAFSSIPCQHSPTVETVPYRWQDHQRRSTFIVDCKPLQEIVCGHIPLIGDSLRPVFRRMVSNLDAILDMTWLPRYNWHDPVIWRRREYNHVADYLANLTMDEGRSWINELAWPFEAWTIRHCNIVVHSDGGSRAMCSAAAWVVEVGICRGSEWEYKPIAMGGTYLEVRVSSFMAEALALEACTNYVKKFL